MIEHGVVASKFIADMHQNNNFTSTETKDTHSRFALSSIILILIIAKREISVLETVTPHIKRSLFNLVIDKGGSKAVDELSEISNNEFPNNDDLLLFLYNLFIYQRKYCKIRSRLTKEPVQISTRRN